MGSKIKRSLFKYLIISLTISIILSIAVQDAAQNISDNIQLKYTDSSKLYEYQNGYSQLFGDVPQIPDVSPEIMTPSDRIAKEFCDFISSWCILFFTLFGVFLSLTLFYKRRLKTPFSVLNEAADKISRQDLDFKISYVYDDELGQICAAFEKMREKLAENNSSMWNMIDEQKQMRSAFSHDLRTPLAVMKGYVEYLLRYYPKHRLSEEKVIEVLGELQSQTERISCFADTMKNINRLDCNDSFHHYPAPMNVLREVHRVLKPGGTFLMGDCWQPLVGRIIMNFYMRHSKEGDVKIYSEAEIVSMLSKYFRNVSWEQIGNTACIAMGEK